MAKAKIYIGGWIEYDVNDAQQLIDAAAIRNPDYSAEALAPNALMVLTRKVYRRENYQLPGASVATEELSYNSLSPEER